MLIRCAIAMLRRIDGQAGDLTSSRLPRLAGEEEQLVKKRKLFFFCIKVLSTSSLDLCLLGVVLD